MVRALRDRCIEATILTLAQAGEVVFIPRITLINDGPHNTLPVQLKRLQFPVCLAFAMTMNKSQGQTVPRVGDYLPDQFLHTGSSMLRCHASRHVPTFGSWLSTPNPMSPAVRTPKTSFTTKFSTR